MSFDKVKAMRNAERFLSQGKIRAAITEYKRIVENDPKDYSTLNVLGDLYVKNNESSAAVGCYTKVAEHFSKQGFAQKAIAIYNKISRIQPNSADVSAKLAKLYQMKGSFAEARSHYVALAEQYQRKGQKGEALEIWKQIAQLDPTNTEVYLKIAEFCSQDGNKEEAAKAFTEAGLRFSSQNQLDAALNAFSQALELRQYDLTALNGLVNTQVRLGYSDEAAKTLENILEKQPYNREILYLLVDCYLDADNPAEAEKAVIRLVEQEPANYPKFLKLVEVYIKHNDLDSAVRILSMSSEHLLVGGKPDEFLKWTNEILARNPEQLDALRLLVRYHGWQRDESELKKSLERLAEIARLKDSVDDEHYALSQLVLIIPHEVSLRQTPPGNQLSIRRRHIGSKYGF
jgi:tetratricopeptide (TPR) repeat protein